MAVKKKSISKAPKAKASLSTWQKYEEKVKNVIKYNAELIKNEKKKQDLIKKIQSLKK